MDTIASFSDPKASGELCLKCDDHHDGAVLVKVDVQEQELSPRELACLRRTYQVTEMSVRLPKPWL